MKNKKINTHKTAQLGIGAVTTRNSLLVNNFLVKNTLNNLKFQK